MKHRLFLVLGCALLVALPTTLLLPGCGGGNSNLGSGSFSSTVTLSPSQVGYLSLTTGGTVANGFLRVASSSAADAGEKTTRAFKFAVANGNYGFTGTFSPPNGFSATGNFGGSLPFTIVGQIPTNGGSGNYTITANGQTVNGNFQTGNFTPTPEGTTTGTPVGTSTPTPQPTATQTPSPTSTPATTVNNSVSDITFSNLGGDLGGVNAASTAPFSATLPSNASFKNAGSGFDGTAYFETQVGTLTRRLSFTGPTRSTAVSAGEELLIGSDLSDGKGIITYSESPASGTSSSKSWKSTSGSYIIRSANSNKVSFTLRNVKFIPVFNGAGPMGTFDLNGDGSVGK